MTVTEITSYEQFKEVIDSDTPVIIDFWATWCGPCRVISPIFEKMSGEGFVEGKVAFYKVDVDAQEQISQEVGIRAMPTFSAFFKGEKLDQVVGADPQALQTLVKKVSASQ